MCPGSATGRGRSKIGPPNSHYTLYEKMPARTSVKPGGMELEETAAGRIKNLKTGPPQKEPQRHREIEAEVRKRKRGAH